VFGEGRDPRKGKGNGKGRGREEGKEKRGREEKRERGGREGEGRECASSIFTGAAPLFNSWRHPCIWLHLSTGRRACTHGKAGSRLDCYQQREGKRFNDEMYTNELHNAFLGKDDPGFWKCWRSKFQPANKSVEVDGCVNPDIIVDKFATYFSTCYSRNSTNQKDILKDEFTKLRDHYFGFPSSDISFDTELVSKIILELKRGKAGDM